jgi:hypothetical protein
MISGFGRNADEISDLLTLDVGLDTLSRNVRK